MRRLCVLTVTGVLLWSSSPALSREPQNGGPLQYRVLATSRPSTMERELSVAGNEGFEVLGMTIGKTAIGGKELVTITRRQAR